MFDQEKIEIVCDDSKPMMPYPPLTYEEKQFENEFWAKMENKYLKNVTPFFF